MPTFLDFEKPVAELEARVAELRETASAGEINIEAEIARLEERAEKLLRDTYARLTPWQKTQVARHPERPHFKDYVAALVEDFVPLAGDRGFGDDPPRGEDRHAHKRRRVGERVELIRRSRATALHEHRIARGQLLVERHAGEMRAHDGQTVAHRARVIDLPVVPGDLQQCADSAIRLRAAGDRTGKERRSAAPFVDQ